MTRPEPSAFINDLPAMSVFPIKSDSVHDSIFFVPKFRADIAPEGGFVVKMDETSLPAVGPGEHYGQVRADLVDDSGMREMLVNLLSAYGTLKFIGRDRLKQWVYLTFIRER